MQEDTVYVWKYKNKEIFENKLIDGVFIEGEECIQEQIAYEEAM